MFGYIDIDTDQNSATGGFAPWGGPVTGGNSWINYFILPNAGTPSIPGPLISLGDEFYLDLSTEQFQAGLVDVIRTLDSTVVGTAPISFGTSSFAVAVSLSLLGGDDGLLNFGLLMGNIDAATDRAPDGTDPATVTPASAVPEPGSLAICLTGTAGLVAGYLRRRRKHLQPTGS